jgi:hypothetical protein
MLDDDPVIGSERDITSSPDVVHDKSCVIGAPVTLVDGEEFPSTFHKYSSLYSGFSTDMIKSGMLTENSGKLRKIDIESENDMSS